MEFVKYCIRYFFDTHFDIFQDISNSLSYDSAFDIVAMLKSVYFYLCCLQYDNDAEYGMEAKMLVRNARDIGALIRQTRNDQKMSQRELAEKIGVYQPKISEIERGKPGVGVGLVLQILHALALTIDINSPDGPQMTMPVHQNAIADDGVDDLDAIADTGLE